MGEKEKWYSIISYLKLVTYDALLVLLGEWIKLDDDVVSVVPEEEVLKLSGGG